MAESSLSSRGQLRGQMLRYLLAGSVIFFLGMAQYSLLFALVPRGPYHASLIWALNFGLGTLWTHAIHRFGTFRGVRHLPYFESLLRTYLGYAGVQAIGFVMMLLLVDLGHLHVRQGWVLTTLLISTLNFTILRQFSIVAPRRQDGPQ